MKSNDSHYITVMITEKWKKLKEKKIEKIKVRNTDKEFIIHGDFAK